MERFENLNRTLKLSWDLLVRAAHSRNDGMRTPVLATFDGNLIHQRTIVLRKSKTEKRELYFFSDYRAPKIQHLKINSQLNGVFWSPKKNVQIEARGIGHVHHQDELCREFWVQINATGRKLYAAAQSPGSSLSNDRDYLSDQWPQEEGNLSQTEWAFENFALIVFEVQQMDVLHLHQAGHQRAQFSWEDEEWKKSWVVP